MKKNLLSGDQKVKPFISVGMLMPVISMLLVVLIPALFLYGFLDALLTDGPMGLAKHVLIFAGAVLAFGLVLGTLIWALDHKYLGWVVIALFVLIALSRWIDGPSCVPGRFWDCG